MREVFRRNYNYRHCAGHLPPSGFRFFFYSNEGDPREQPHVHVEKDEMEAKFWLVPEVKLAYNDGFDARTLRALLGIIEGNKDRIEGAWDEFFG